MGQTLTHGVYLPDEGERNCYNGLAANWSILDGAVGTIAEHTTQIAGKANAVHTHTKSDITDFPAYGTTAGTICEGNDSRLSDARTPVAHTHGKADVTDLFNSANTWSGDNTFTAVIRYKTSYTLGNPPQSSDAQQSAIMVTDSAGTNYLAQIATFQSADATGCRIAIRDKFDSNGFSPSGSNRNKYFYLIQNASNQGYLKWDGYINNSIYPLANNSYDLGSSSYQWNNLYAKNYYYNGTAWGLDKYNKWTGVNDFNNLIGLNDAELWFKQPNIEDITTNPSTDTAKSILQIYNKETTQYFGGVADGLMTDGTHRLTISCFGFPLNNYGGYYPHSFSFEAKRDGTASFSPNYTNASLGTSTHKWKTLNGINPGALSLPNGNAQDTSWIGDLTIKDGSNYNLKTFALNGWITINIPNTAGNLVVVNNGCGQIVTNEANGITGNNCAVFMPVVANVQISILLVLQTGESVKTAIFAPCLGNV